MNGIQPSSLFRIAYVWKSQCVWYEAHTTEASSQHFCGIMNGAAARLTHWTLADTCIGWCGCMVDDATVRLKYGIPGGESVYTRLEGSESVFFLGEGCQPVESHTQMGTAYWRQWWWIGSMCSKYACSKCWICQDKSMLILLLIWKTLYESSVMHDDRGRTVHSWSVGLNIGVICCMRLNGILYITRHVTSWYHVCWQTHTYTRGITWLYHWNNCSGSILKVMCLCSGFWWVMRHRDIESQCSTHRKSSRHLIETLRFMPTEEIQATNIFWLIAFSDIHRCLLLDFKLYDNTIIANCSNKVIQNVHTKMKNRQAAKLADGIIMLHDSVHPHVVHRVQDQLIVIQWEVLRHPAYSVWIITCNLHILWSLRKAIKGHTFTLDYDVHETVVQWFRQLKEFLAGGIQWRVHRWDAVKCVW